MTKQNFKKIGQNVSVISILLLCVYYLLVMYSARPGVDGIQFLVINLFLKLFQGSWFLMLVYSQVVSSLDDKEINFRQLFRRLGLHLFIFLLAVILLRIFNPDFSWYQEFSSSSFSIAEQILSIFIISILMTVLGFITSRFRLPIFNRKLTVILSFFASFFYLYSLNYILPDQSFVDSSNFAFLYTTNILFWLYFFCLAKWTAHHFETVLNFLDDYIALVAFAFVASFSLIVYLEFTQIIASPLMNPLYLIVYTALFGMVLNIARIFMDMGSILIEMISDRIYIIAIIIPITAQIFRTAYSNYFDSTLLFILIGMFFVLSSAIGISIFLKPLKRF